MADVLREHARAIWSAAVQAVRPEPLVRAALTELADTLRTAPRILVLGAGKAAAAMAAAVELVLADQLDRIEGIVNIPGHAANLQKIRLHSARPAATNEWMELHEHHHRERPVGESRPWAPSAPAGNPEDRVGENAANEPFWKRRRNTKRKVRVPQTING